jgi:hypothetical protein
MRIATIRFLVVAWLVALLAPSVQAEGQAGRMVKVVMETRQQGTQSRQGVQGSGGVIVQGALPAPAAGSEWRTPPPAPRAPRGCSCW